VSAREDYDRKTASLVGLRVEAVEYWDIYNFSDEPREWDYGHWHHAVMGVGLQTSAGPFSVLWTNTFYEYGVEVFPDPMTSFLQQGEHAPESWSVTDHAQWRSRAGQPVTAVATHWERIGPQIRFKTATEVPTALRLDFAAGPVWFIAGMPNEDGDLFIPADEIAVAFTTEAMLGFGYPPSPFTLT
jgi:hypothetical protein